MSINNQMYKFYNEMVKGYKENQDGLFEHGVRCWLELKPENPFPFEDPAYEEFFQMQRGYSLWQMGGADRKINRRRMLEAARRLCALNPKKPYKFDRKAEEEEKAAKAAEEARLAENKKESTNEAPTRSRGTKTEAPPQYVFGVLPEESADKTNPTEKKGLLGKLFKK